MGFMFYCQQRSSPIVWPTFIAKKMMDGLAAEKHLRLPLESRCRSVPYGMFNHKFLTKVVGRRTQITMNRVFGKLCYVIFL